MTDHLYIVHALLICFAYRYSACLINVYFQVAVFQCIEEKLHHVLVLNTHLYSDGKASHIRLIQAALCMQHIERVLEYLLKDNVSQLYSLIFFRFTLD